MATPAEMLDAIEGHLAEGSPLVSPLVSHAPSVVGVPGKAHGADDGGALFVYGPRQMKGIRKVIYDAARQDLAGG